MNKVNCLNKEIISQYMLWSSNLNTYEIFAEASIFRLKAQLISEIIYSENKVIRKIVLEHSREIKYVIWRNINTLSKVSSSHARATVHTTVFQTLVGY